MSRRSSPLSAVSVGYLEHLYRLYRADPTQLDESWQCLFGVLDSVGEANDVDLLAGLAGTGPDARLTEAIRSRGHLFAQLDPLANPAAVVLYEAFAPHLPPPPPGDAGRCHTGTMAVESAHVDDPRLRAWLIAASEAAGPAFPAGDQRKQLRHLIDADEFERFLGRKYPTKKRFGAEGADALVPLLRHVLHHASAAGVTHVVIGSMHRGRLNLMANVLGYPLPRLLAEFKGAHPFPADPQRPADVPYHLGHVGQIDTPAGSLELLFLANPSHLEAVDPVVLGRARALQDAQGSAARVLPIIIHTDAAVIGQGVVAELLQLAGVPGFSTGGTVHLVVNNQIGFTTEPSDARTSLHCTGAWKAVDSCIVHVNGDDLEAVLRAASLAVDWRQAHGRDAVIDLVCYRRHGHNEIDEPTFTQPLLYRRIADQLPLAEATARRLVRQGITDDAAVAAIRTEARAQLDAAYETSKTFLPNESGYATPARAQDGPTGIELGRLRAVTRALAQPPDGMALHPKMGRLLQQREPGSDGVSWPVAESLAFASLLQDGVSVRLTGQDVVRGAFSHRHYTLTDTATGHRHNSLAALAAGGARFDVFNSPLSEYAVLGFEYGYSLGAPNGLTVWEAQFGDFANGAQIILDQFVTAAEAKWCSQSGLVLLLPHGLEGQGPEHSSARLERFLLMAAGNNIRIANPSTPANYFHLLRRQALAGRRTPLVVMGAKRLLRLPAAISPSEAFGPGRQFEPVLIDAPGPAIARILLCSGKIAYDLLAERDRQDLTDTAIVRLEELYPFPETELRAMFARWPTARCCWVQEEPRNMGAWSWLDRRIEQVRRDAGALEPGISYVGRPDSASPAGSFHGDHEADQARIVAHALGAWD